MKKRYITRLVACTLAAAMAFSATTFAGATEGYNRLESTDKYTFRDPSSTPRSLNPHDIEGTYAGITTYQWYLSTPFALRVATPEGSENFWEWKMFAATNYTDVTADFANKSTYGVPAGALEGYVYQVDLREDMKWHDGTPINAESYVTSAKHYFNPEMLSGSSNGDFGSAVIANGTEYYNGEVEWEDVGLWASGDYQLTFVLKSPLYGDDKYAIDGSYMLVHEGLYTGGMETREELLATTYMTTLETMASSGPYMVVSYEFDKQLVMERNPYWFGWFDEDFEGFWNMTDIVLEVVSDADTQELLFNQGYLDRIRLSVTTYPKYRFSDYLLQYGSTNLYRYVFNSDYEKLAAIETTMADGFNRRVLSIDKFREAMSYAFDRAAFTEQTSAGWLPSVVLMDNYYTDLYENEMYRDTDHAKRAIVELYGLEYGDDKPYKTLDDAYNNISGYNLDKAKTLFQEAYDIAIADGLYKDGETVNIHFYVSSGAVSATAKRQEELLNQFFTAATEGTGFEGKFVITFIGNFAGAAAALTAGTIEAIHTAWGGDIASPWGMIGVYTDVTGSGRSLLNIYESSGWDPSQEKLTLNYDFFQTGRPVEITMSLDEWHKTINGTSIFTSPEQMDVRVFITAQLEKAVIASYQTIPYGLQQISELHSMRINLAPVHPLFFEYTERSQITFNYTDAEWEAFIAQNGGTLNYE
jgi:ABC-type oligopeptide transport system substrate-binding subunit